MWSKVDGAEIRLTAAPAFSWRHRRWATGPRPRWPLPATERQIEYTCDMMGNTFGRAFTLTTFGETHSARRGAVVDGCLPIAEAMVALVLTGNLVRNRGQDGTRQGLRP